MNKKIILIASSLLMMIILMANILAITGSIGNARMVLRVETGDEIEKYILVKNVNDVRVDIELSASGDLEDYIKIKDDKFSLEPREEKKAYFTIDAAKAGTTKTKINVRFKPEQGNSVGLSSMIIVIAEGEEPDISIEKYADGIKLTTGKIIEIIKNKEENNIIIVMVAFSLILLVLLAMILLTKQKSAEKNKLKKSVKKRD